MPKRSRSFKEVWFWCCSHHIIKGKRGKEESFGKRLGRPPKVQDENKYTVKKPKGKDVKASSKVHNVQNKDGSSESVIGFKRQMEAECLDQTELENEVNESGERTGRPQKKQKRLGRPPKVQDENKYTVKKPKGKDVKASSKVHNVQNKDGSSESVVGFKRQMEAECLDQTELENEVNESSERTGRPQKKQKRLGIPHKVQGENKDTVKRPKVHNVQNEDGSSEIANDNKQTVKVSEESNAVTTTEVTVKPLEKEVNESSKRMRRPQKKHKRDGRPPKVQGENKDTVKKPKGKDVKGSSKKKKYGKNKAQVVFIGEAPPKKKPGKKIKDGNKKKERRANKSSLKKGPKVTQKGKQNRKPRLLAQSSEKGSDQEDGDALFSGKRNLISWMLDLGVITPGGKLQYRECKRRKGLSEGTVSHDGIHCNCCNEVMDVSKFVSHGGWKLDEALKNICYQSGPSLLTCLLKSWKKEEESTSIKFNSVNAMEGDPNDDTCNICGDGGDLICCDGCPSTFNQSCLDIQNFPSGDWHCIYCSCKFCGLADSDASQVDDSEDAPNSEMLTCSMCEQKFHDSCLHALCASKDEDAVNLESSCLSFCGKKCRELYEQLQTYIDVKFELKDGYSMTLLKRSELSQDSTLNDPLKVLCNSKLAVAFSVMCECFVPVMDERSGVNVIHNVVYNCGSNFTRLNFSGFCTAILERSGELIAAASIRIHGHQLAEMPFIGTRNMYRRQGMCRRLLDAIEDASCSLGVREAMKGMSVIVFPGTDLLQKPLYKNQVADNNQVAGSKLSPLTSKDVLKVAFDLNLRPAATDTDVQPIDDDDAILRDPQVCKNSFELSDSRAQVDKNASQPLVLV
ncbi:acyl-CoA N-acyltransferase with RING/FYVE/PHD-type zinc finger protein [Tanacetum coccineum]